MGQLISNINSLLSPHGARVSRGAARRGFRATAPSSKINPALLGSRVNMHTETFDLVPGSRWRGKSEWVRYSKGTLSANWTNEDAIISSTPEEKWTPQVGIDGIAWLA